MEEENLDEFFDLRAILPELYSSDHQQLSDFNNGSRIKAAANASWNNSCAKPSSSSPEFISFENPKYLPSPSPESTTASYGTENNNCSNLDMLFSGGYSAPEVINFSKKPAPARTGLQAQEHVVAERQRRDNLRQLFISLSKIVPGLKKLDKASMLEDAIEHTKALEERVRVLEEEAEEEEEDMIRKSSINNGGRSTVISESAAPKIQARISDKHVLIKIFCKKQMDLVSGIPGEMEKMNLSVVDLRIMPFGRGDVDITVLAEVQGEFRGTVKDIVDHLHTVFFNPRDTISSDSTISN